MLRKFLRLGRDTSGNVAFLFALVLIPILTATGAAIDYNRAMTARSKLATAVDAATLALARQPMQEDGSAQQFLTDYISQTLDAVGFNASTWSITSFTQTHQAIDVAVAGSMDTVIMGLVNIDHIPFGTSTSVVREQKKVELALVLDNTGSMNSSGKIGALRDAANELIDIMFEGANSAENVDVALVPFVTSVNIRAADVFNMDWMDTEGAATYHGVNFDESSGQVNHFDLFDQISNTEWKGCVEARAEPYDTDDTPPSGSSPDTLFVPWFWPDEPDYGWSYHNDYMNDQVSWGTSAQDRQKSTAKYGSANASIDESPSSTSGPNKSCGQPILPLTNEENTLHSEIDAMRAWNSSGTNIAQGLVWGWRVLSPGEPFTEGVPYSDEETMKALVLLSDGENQVVSQNNSHNYSDYNGYNYLSQGRLGTTSTYSAIGQVNDKVATLCQSIKDQDIRVYTITFKLNSGSLQSLFRDCATDPDLYFNSPSNEDLRQAFEEIAYDLSKLRLAK